MKAKGRNPVPVNLVFDRKEKSGRLIHMKSRNEVKGCMQVHGVDFTESFSPVASYTSTRILIRLTLYHEEYGWIADLCDVEAALLHPNMEFEMYIE